MGPWLSIIGIGEDGVDGLSQASRTALDDAEIVFGGQRHLELAGIGARGRAWPVPFSIEPVLTCRGRKVAVLASGDPFWFGVGGTLACRLPPDEWQAFPGVSTFSLIAARLGWRLEETACLGLHAAPFGQLLAPMADGFRAICLLRDGEAVPALCGFLAERGYGATRVHIFEAVGGPRERCFAFRADEAGRAASDVQAPVAVALEPRGGPGLIRASGLPDEAFVHDGQITKGPVRALTLSALAPLRGARLWDIGAGSGSVSIEWLLAAGRGGEAIAVEPRADRAANIRANADRFGVADRLTVVEAAAPEALVGLAPPQAVFVGGGASEALLRGIFDRVPTGTRIVVNAVTLETEALLASWSERCGGELLRIELASAKPLGRRRGWSPVRPVVQWSVER